MIVAYDVSKSMRINWEWDTVIRMNRYLCELLFDEMPKIPPPDRILLVEKTPLFGDGVPLLKKGDRLSFIMFGGPPIPSPQFTMIYEDEKALKERLLAHLPEERGEFDEDWTCIDLLHWKATRVFKEYPVEGERILVLVSDLCESRYPLNQEDLKRILFYKERYDKDILLDLMAGAFHLQVSRIIPPRSGIEILDPRPGEEVYYAGRPLIVRARILKEGSILKEEGWEVLATLLSIGKPYEKREAILNDKGLGKDEKSGDGVYTGLLPRGGGGEMGLVITALKGPVKFQTEELRLFLASPPGPPIWFIVAAVILLGLLIQYRLWPIRLWVEREGGPPRRVELKRVGDMVFLGKREEEPYVDLNLPGYSILRQKRRELVLWREGKEEGEVIPWDRWFSPQDDEEVVLRFSLKRPEKGGRRIEPPKRIREGDFYKW